ncbi:ABC transporter substrate-binding protein [Novosphingobium piscinae]|uniref:ABC transporter substrate-binding protein n=1 Tax=Novosphingobium piscinae TaxID=1507448 RepID=A0A7X1KQT1_9SPHN|nr:ABC transporter substrate-binding protein [Novosphingobium piscinae]MBC2670032.1 ABC transporter substrate-binding protein [Novosphingobium piscinae]
MRCCGPSGAVRLIVVPLAALAVLAGCRGDNEQRIDLAVIGRPADLAERGARLGVAGQLVQAATAQGLVALDAQGQVVPALADRWIVTDDGDSYIFRLRDGTWPDGTPLSGQTVARALRQALDGLRGTPLGLDLADLAEVRVMTDRVLELRLARPVPELLQLLAQPELALRRRERGSGPLEPAASAAGTLRLVLIPPTRLGLPALDPADPRPASLQLRALSARAATEAFARGELSLVFGGRFADLPQAQAVAGLSRRALQVDPAAGLFGLAVVGAEGPLAAPEFREALAMAIDRDALAGAMGLTGWTPTTRIVPLSVPGSGGALTLPARAGAEPAAPVQAAAPAWTTAPLDLRQAEAAARVARWTGRSGRPLASLRLAWPSGPGADAVFERLRTDFAAIGVTLTRVAAEAPADLRLLDLVARYPGPLWYLNQLSCPARRTICSTAADARLAEARAERDPARRLAMLAAVEAQMSAAAVFLPLGPPVRWSLVRPGTPGFAPNTVAFHPLPPLVEQTD